MSSLVETNLIEIRRPFSDVTTATTSQEEMVIDKYTFSEIERLVAQTIHRSLHPPVSQSVHTFNLA